MPFDPLIVSNLKPKYRFTLTKSAAWVGLWALLACQWVMAASNLDAIKQSIQTGQLDQAIKLVQQERQTAPKDVQLQFLEGVILAQQGKHSNAIDAFRKLTEAHPELPEPYNNLGVLYASQGRLEDARIAFDKAIQTHASYSAAHKNLSDVQAQLARQTYARALQVDPKVKGATAQLTLLGAITSEHSDGTKVTSPSVPVRPTAPPVTTTPVVVTQVQPVAPAAAGKSQEEIAKEAALQRAAKDKETAKEAAKETAKDAVKESVKAAAEKQKEDNAEAESVKTAVQNWARAWSQKDIKKYFSAYATNFDPPDHLTRSKWEAERELRITSKKKIQVAVSNFKIDINGSKAKISFSQIYESDNFKGNSRKSLELTKQGGRWMITRETVN
jgi:tetratricopeptide (TPR) repeat protein